MIQGVANTIKNGALIWVRGEGKFALIGWISAMRGDSLADGASLALSVQLVVVLLVMFYGWAIDVVENELDRAWARGGGGVSWAAWVMNLRCVREKGDSTAKALFSHLVFYWRISQKSAGGELARLAVLVHDIANLLFMKGRAHA